MNSEQLETYLVALTSSVTIGIIIPILILLGITSAIWMLISRAQKDPEFDIANTLRDEAGKESATKVLTFGAFAVTSWGLAVVVFALPQYFEQAFFWYLFFWSGTQVALKMADKWSGTLPFTKGS